LHLIDEARRMRRNAEVKAPRFFPMCRQALFQKAPRQLYLANCPHPTHTTPRLPQPPPLHGLFALQIAPWLRIRATQEGSHQLGTTQAKRSESS